MKISHPLVRPEDVVEAVAKTWGETPNAVRYSRTQRPTEARFAAIWILRKMGYTYNAMKPIFKKKDHSVFIHAVQKAEGWREVYPAFREALDQSMAIVDANFVAQPEEAAA